MAPRSSDPLTSSARDYARVERALLLLHQARATQPSLAELADALELSPFHAQRLVQRWAGVSPKRFLQFLTREHAKTLLDRGAPLLETAHRTGLSGTGRLHDLFVTTEALTPGSYQQHGRGLVICWGEHASPFGPALVATTERGLCGVSFGEERGELLERFSNATVRRDAAFTRRLVERIFCGPGVGAPLAVFLRGSPFQLQVWQALLEIPEGSVQSYQAIARAVGRPAAARATGGAIGANPIAYLIPCHRVIQRIGLSGSYRWGALRKRAMLAWEAGRSTLGP